MRNALVFVVTLLLSTPLVAQTATDPGQDPTAATTALFKALLDEDSNKMLALTTDDFAIISYDGQTADRDLMGQALSGGILVVDALAPTGTRARTYNNDAAVVSGSTKFKGNLQGTAFDTEVVFTATCVKQGNTWKVASVQFSGK
ncbi:MAG: nuclear transport factor 2 family protein [Cytophagales bacterium]|nr:MAG: nuclear transport factor 2 family protein [Cytophagales bacterium]